MQAPTAAFVALPGDHRSAPQRSKPREGFQNIANTLQPSLALSNIFEGNKAATAQTIQTELESEQFMGTESARRKKLKELGTNIFNQSTGMSTGRTVSYSNYSSAGQI